MVACHSTVQGTWYNQPKQQSHQHPSSTNPPHPATTINLQFREVSITALGATSLKVVFPNLAATLGSTNARLEQGCVVAGHAATITVCTNTDSLPQLDSSLFTTRPLTIPSSVKKETCRCITYIPLNPTSTSTSRPQLVREPSRLDNKRLHGFREPAP
jgi:hypothetical protein